MIDFEELERRYPELRGYAYGLRKLERQKNLGEGEGS